MQLDQMRTWFASKSQTFWKLRLPASMPYLFTSLKIGMAASLVGAIVGELPTGAVAGLGARSCWLVSYYGQTIQIWSCLVDGGGTGSDACRDHRDDPADHAETDGDGVMGWLIFAVVAWIVAWMLNVWLARRPPSRLTGLASPIVFGHDADRGLGRGRERV